MIKNPPLMPTAAVQAARRLATCYPIQPSEKDIQDLAEFVIVHEREIRRLPRTPAD